MTLAIAHRGDPIGAVENTLDAVVAAVGLGADAIEVDVRLTRDGTVVLHHDTDLQRLWKHPAAIARTAFAELRRLAPRVPTLDEALDAVRDTGTPLVLDVADADVALAAYAVAERAGALDRLWFCGDAVALAAVRARDESIALMLTWEKVRGPGERTLEATRPTFFNPFHRLVSRGSVRAWHEHGVKVCAWTVDDPGRLARLTEWGIDAIISNNVAAAVASVAGSGPSYAGR